MDFKAKWITASNVPGHISPVFGRHFSLRSPVRQATLYATALGVYEAYLNDRRVGDFIMAPGWTVYEKRLQVQTYDVTDLLGPKNDLAVTVGPGWYASPLGWARAEDDPVFSRKLAFLGELHILYSDGTEAILPTDESWLTGESPVRLSEIYNGETYDARVETSLTAPAAILDHPYDMLIPQEGEEVTEQERVAPRAVIHTPAGETVVDFGQEVTGYVEFTLDAHAGDQVRILHGEVLDRDGNFYNANYRTAKAEINYTCAEGRQTYHPHLTFYGFRYIKLDKWPSDSVRPEDFTAIQVNSAIRRTGSIESSDPLLNQLFSNVIWSQKGNFLDIPTDCPQRDERLGWTGDAQQFIKAASYNFDVDRFFTKWLHDMTADQAPDGGIPHVIPNILQQKDFEGGTVEMDPCATGWADAATVCPWQLYITYGDRDILRDQFDTMKKWVGYIPAHSKDKFLWTGGTHFGDWLGLDAPSGTYKGASRDDFLASAYYARSVEQVIKAGRVLGEDVSEYEELHAHIVSTFRRTYPEYTTQTEHVIAVRFGLAEDPQAAADALARMVRRDGSMKTGFLGTPHLLHVLSDYGYGELAYELLLRREYPSWLYSVTKGATTTWEHWDSLMEDGSFWSTDMNSFNHYSYGSVMDWVYEKAAGIMPVEESPGFARVRIAPLPSEKLQWLGASIVTRYGPVSSHWTRTPAGIRYDITIPVEGETTIGGETRLLPVGSYIFWEEQP